MRSAVYQSGCQHSATPGRLPHPRRWISHPSRCSNQSRLCTARSFIKDVDGRNPLATPAELPLLGKRIIVTAPRQYSQKLSSKLINAGARPLVVPAVQISGLYGSDLYNLKEQLRQLLVYPPPGQPPITHVAFTSKNGIHATLEPLSELLGGLDAACAWLAGSGVRLCALGADGEVLAEMGLPVHVSPPEASTLGLVKDLVRRGEAAGARVLCPVPLVTGGLVEPPVVPRFLKALQDAGAHPVRLPAYLTTLGCTAEDCTAELAALEGGHVAAVAFSSTAEAQGLVQLMGGRERFASAVRQHGVVLSAHGPYTAEGAGAVLGVPVTVVSKQFSTFGGLVAALEEHFAGVGREQEAVGSVPVGAAG